MATFTLTSRLSQRTPSGWCDTSYWPEILPPRTHSFQTTPQAEALFQDYIAAVRADLMHGEAAWVYATVDRFDERVPAGFKRRTWDVHVQAEDAIAA